MASDMKDAGLNPHRPRSIGKVQERVRELTQSAEAHKKNKPPSFSPPHRSTTGTTARIEQFTSGEAGMDRPTRPPRPLPAAPHESVVQQPEDTPRFMAAKRSCSNPSIMRDLSATEDHDGVQLYLDPTARVSRSSTNVSGDIAALQESASHHALEDDIPENDDWAPLPSLSDDDIAAAEVANPATARRSTDPCSNEKEQLSIKTVSDSTSPQIGISRKTFIADKKKVERSDSEEEEEKLPRSESETSVGSKINSIPGSRSDNALSLHRISASLPKHTSGAYVPPSPAANPKSPRTKLSRVLSFESKDKPGLRISREKSKKNAAATFFDKLRGITPQSTPERMTFYMAVYTNGSISGFCTMMLAEVGMQLMMSTKKDPTVVPYGEIVSVSVDATHPNRHALLLAYNRCGALHRVTFLTEEHALVMTTINEWRQHVQKKSESADRPKSMRLTKVTSRSTESRKKRKSAQKVFEVALIDLVARDPSLDVPRIIHTTINYLVSQDHIKKEGIFRVEASLARVRELKAVVDSGIANDLSELFSDPLEASTLLTTFLLDLPNPLLTCELYPAFIAAYKIKSPTLDTLTQELHALVQRLPVAHQRLLCTLLRLLALVAAHADENKVLVRHGSIERGRSVDASMGASRRP
mmetsp:Transcript_7847/g.19794  ORF Transcript_7847/g.19794 Transcript_7847/m.19794 type:complete len:642 (+) Transcript_7847:296-2221(+)